jgi:hypothetical protein
LDNLKLVLSEEHTSLIGIKTITHSSSGKPATPQALHKVALSQLQAGVCIFWYKKKDGTLRKAIGTLRSDLIPLSQTGKAPQQNTTKQNYYDLDVAGFRAFEISSIIAVLVS